MTPLAEGIWTTSAPVSFIGLQLSSTMTVIRLSEGLLLHSPVAMTPELRAAVEDLGEIAHLYAPNTFHHMWLGEWSEAFPEAQVHAPAELAKKRSELRIDRHHGGGFSEELVEVPIEGFRLRETALVHPATNTLIVTDVVHNIGRPEHGWTKLYTDLMGFYDEVALSRFIRWTGFDDKVAARRSVDALLDLPIERLIVGHGAPILENAGPALRSAYTWLP